MARFVETASRGRSGSSFYRDPNDDNAFFVYEAYRDLDASKRTRRTSRSSAGRPVSETRSEPTSPWCFERMRFGPRPVEQRSRRDSGMGARPIDTSNLRLQPTAARDARCGSYTGPGRRRVSLMTILPTTLMLMCGSAVGGELFVAPGYRVDIVVRGLAYP